jgi:hypothetical protein
MILLMLTTRAKTKTIPTTSMTCHLVAKMLFATNHL